jgi:hypothetical protein
MELADERGRAALHRRQRDGARVAALPSEAEICQLPAGGARDLGGRDVRHERRFTEDPDVDHGDPDARLPEPVPDESVLRALGVQRADEDHGALPYGPRHGSSSRAHPSALERVRPKAPGGTAPGGTS